MNKRDRDRRNAFLQVFQGLFYWPSDTMTVKCWRKARERLNDQELDKLLNTMIDVHNHRIHRNRKAERATQRGLGP